MISRGISKQPGVYAIVHLTSRKVYVGSAVNLWDRCKVHLYNLRRGTHHSPYLQHAWNKHGSCEFVFMPLEIVPDKGDLIRIEQEYMDRIRPCDPESGYNISTTAGSLRGLKRPAEFGANSSARQKGKTFSDAHRANISAARTGIKVPPFSDEHRAKISEGRKGKKLGRPKVILKPDDVLDIRRRVAGGENRKDVAALYGLHGNYVRLIEIGKRWGWLVEEQPGPIVATTVADRVACGPLVQAFLPLTG